MQLLHKTDIGELWHGDCLPIMRYCLYGRDVDMVLTDPPYGTTNCKWDTVIQFDLMWEGIWGAVKRGAAVVITGAEPFSSALRMSQIEQYRYDWVWVKEQGVDPFMAKKRPLNNVENVSVFSRGTLRKYRPQMKPGKPYAVTRDRNPRVLAITGTKMRQTTTVNAGFRYPKRTIRVNRETGLHPTQKPVSLFSYLIRTYTDSGDTVLDPCAGSGTTAIAAEQTGRKWICIEQERKYCDIILQRLEALDATA